MNRRWDVPARLVSREHSPLRADGARVEAGPLKLTICVVPTDQAEGVADGLFVVVWP